VNADTEAAKAGGVVLALVLVTRDVLAAEIRTSSHPPRTRHGGLRGVRVGVGAGAVYCRLKYTQRPTQQRF
jgi:hypothetical protein